MKTIILSSLLVISTLGQEEEKAYGGYEITLGGSGSTVSDRSSGGMDFSISSNPLKSVPSLWFGLNQGVYWEDGFSGSTDLNVNWSWHLVGDLYLNTGWSVGGEYWTGGCFNVDYRTGPEATFQYYFGKAFVYTGVNYDIGLSGQRNGWRYSLGIGIAF
jgi:hypothetical protein